MLTSKKVSESIRLGSILMFSGGFLDAYSYLVRGQVFATAETGNIALMGISLARGDLAGLRIFTGRAPEKSGRGSGKELFEPYRQ